MATTIQISEKLKEKLNKMKLSSNETYEEVISNLIEDTMEVSEETKKDIASAREDIRQGRVKTLSQVKKELGL